MDYYELLQISPDADVEVIKGAYKYLIQKWHPDKNPGNAALAHKMTRLLNEAYATLSDPVLRQKYDAQIGVNAERMRKGNDYPGRFAQEQIDKNYRLPGNEKKTSNVPASWLRPVAVITLFAILLFLTPYFLKGNGEHPEVLLSGGIKEKEPSQKVSAISRSQIEIDTFFDYDQYSRLILDIPLRGRIKNNSSQPLDCFGLEIGLKDCRLHSNDSCDQMYKGVIDIEESVPPGQARDFSREVRIDSFNLRGSLQTEWNLKSVSEDSALSPGCDLLPLRQD